MSRYMTLLLLCLAFIMQSCSENISLTFGSGGGFTGGVEEYIINEGGKLFSSNPIKETKEKIGEISKKEIKDIAKLITKDELMELTYNEPNNFYKYITLTQGKTIKKYTWSDAAQNESTDKLNRLFNLLMSMVNDDQ